MLRWSSKEQLQRLLHVPQLQLHRLQLLRHKLQPFESQRQQQEGLCQ